MHINFNLVRIRHKYENNRGFASAVKIKQSRYRPGVAQRVPGI